MKILTDSRINECGKWNKKERIWEFGIWNLDKLLQAQAELTRDEITTNLAIKNWDKANKHTRQDDEDVSSYVSNYMWKKIREAKNRPDSGTIEFPYLPDTQAYREFKFGNESHTITITQLPDGRVTRKCTCGYEWDIPSMSLGELLSYYQETYYKQIG